MISGKPISKYQVAAKLRDGVVEWTFAVQTDDGQFHVLPVRDGEEMPILIQMCRDDNTVYFDAATGTLRSGWNSPGEGLRK